MGTRARSSLILLCFLLALSACTKGGVSGGSSSAAPALSYYVDATSGNDSNAGTSADAPWKTLAKVNNFTFSSGSTIYLKRGETWFEQLTIPSSNITLDAYGSGALPTIDGSVAVTGWTNVGGGIYSKAMALAPGEGLGNIAEDGAMMKFVAWDTNLATTLGAAANGTFSFSYPDSMLYIKVAANPSTKSYRASRKLYGVSIDSKSNIAIRNVHITQFSLMGVDIMNSHNCSVTDSVIEKGGGAYISPNPLSSPPDYLYAGNGVQYGNTSSNGTVDNVTMTEIFDSGVSPQTFQSNQTATNFVFKNSTLDKCGFAGVEISVLSNGGTTGNVMTGVRVENVTITNSGKGWAGRRYGSEGHGIRVGVDAGTGVLSGTFIENCTVDGAAGDGIHVFGEVDTVTINRTRLKNNAGSGIKVPEPSATSLKLVLTSSLIHNNSTYGLSFTAPNARGFDVYQNTFYNNGTINFAVSGQAGAANIKNNIFYGSAPMTHLYVVSTLSGASVNYNCYNDGVNLFGYNSIAYSSLASFNAATTLEANGKGDGIVGLFNAAAGNFTLTAASDCKALGSTGVGIQYDYSGALFAAPRSAGAYQY